MISMSSRPKRKKKECVQLIAANPGWLAVFATLGRRGDVETFPIAFFGLFKGLRGSSVEALVTEGTEFVRAKALPGFIGLAAPEEGTNEIHERLADDSAEYYDLKLQQAKDAAEARAKVPEDEDEFH